jgi:hypothetical protein
MKRELREVLKAVSYYESEIRRYQEEGRTDMATYLCGALAAMAEAFRILQGGTPPTGDEENRDW